MKIHKTILGLGIVFLLSLLITLPLFGKGYIPTHDGEYHIIRFVEFFRMLSAGYWFPRWAPTLNSGYGIPIFLFYYPFPDYIGSAFHSIGFDMVRSFQVSLAISYIVSGVFVFLWLTKLFSIKASVVGAILSLCVPYWFVDLYVRGSIGEAWAMSFIFGFLALVEHKKRPLLPFMTAGLILSHNILAFLFIPFLAGYCLLRDKKSIWAVVLGILLASYFWIPAFFERVYVVGLNTVSFRDHFVQLYELLIPSWGTGLSGQGFSSDKISFQIGIIPLSVCIGSAYVLYKDTKNQRKRMAYYFFFVSALAVILLLPWSSIVWGVVPLFSFIQYPWRFLSFIIPATAFFGAYVSEYMHMRFWSILLILLALVFCFSYTRPVVYAPRDDAYYLSRSNFTDGTSSMGNSFSTIWTSWKKERPEVILEIKNGKTDGEIYPYTYLKRSFTLWTDVGSEVHLPILYFPGWKAIIDRKEVSIDYTKDGSIRFAVPSGKHSVSVEFTETPLRGFADMISVFTLVWLLGWGILKVYANSHNLYSSS